MQYCGISGHLNWFFWSCVECLKYYIGGKVIEVFTEMTENKYLIIELVRFVHLHKVLHF